MASADEATAQRYPLAWYDIHNAVERLALHIKANAGTYNIRRIIGISRGGLIPAVMLSHRLDIPMEIIKIQTRPAYKLDPKDAVGVVDVPITDGPDGMDAIIECRGLTQDPLMYSAETLVIDDIWDTGRTMALAATVLPNVHFATITHKGVTLNKQGPYIPHALAGIRIPQDMWAVFPWER